MEKKFLELVAEERDRQITEEGFTHEHDDQHMRGELARAAAAYAAPQYVVPLWPIRWTRAWFKPTPGDRKRELVKAGALLQAEFERIERREEPVERMKEESV